MECGRRIWTEADCKALERIDLAVAYVLDLERILELAVRREVPLNLYALITGDGFPSVGVARRFIDRSSTSIRLFLTKGFYHPKIMWFRGVGAYVGSANLTDSAWKRNAECGIWVGQVDLERLGWVDQLSMMFASIADHCTEATSEHIERLAMLQEKRRLLNRAELDYNALVARAFEDIPGDRPMVDETRQTQIGGAARGKFSAEWSQGLTILRKISARFDVSRHLWPAWVDPKTAPSIVQDQATEWWWDTEFRRGGESQRAMSLAHERNV